MDKELKLTQEAIETYEAPQIEVIDIEVEENIMQGSGVETPDFPWG